MVPEQPPHVSAAENHPDDIIFLSNNITRIQQNYGMQPSK
jgi:hypothetical protein